MNLKHSFCISRNGGRSHGGNSPKYTKQPFLLLDRFTHSVRETVKESSDVPRLSSRDKQKFIDMMRVKLDSVYTQVYYKNINRLLKVVADKHVSDMKKNVIKQRTIINNASANDEGKGCFMETEWRVSNGFLEAKRKAEKERMKTFPHINDVEELCIASEHHQVGMERSEKLKELVCAWLGVISEGGRLSRLQPHFRGISFEKDAALVREEKEVATENPGLSSRPEWLRFADQCPDVYGDEDEEDEIIVSDWYHSQASLDMKRRYPLRFFFVTKKLLSSSFDTDCLYPLLAEWTEFLQPKKNDWMALLDRLDKSYSGVYFKVAEHALDEESFKEANIRDCLDIIYMYYKQDRDIEKILNKMKDKDMLPDILFFALKARMHSKAGNLDLAKEALDHAKNAFESLRSLVFQPDTE